MVDKGARKKFEDFWGVKDLPDKNGLMIPEMMEGLVDKKVRAFYIFGENMANTEPDIRKVEHELASAEFLICQDIFLNETTEFADVVFPAAAWSENDGTFTNSERRVSRVRTASPAPRGGPPQLVDLQGACQTLWPYLEVSQRPGDLGQRDFLPGPGPGRHQVRTH